jgi:hypothetical protein
MINLLYYDLKEYLNISFKLTSKNIKEVLLYLNIFYLFLKDIIIYSVDSVDKSRECFCKLVFNMSVIKGVT